MHRVTYINTYNADQTYVAGIASVNVLIILVTIISRAETCLFECATLLVEIKVWNGKILILIECTPLRPESSKNIQILFQGAELYFSNQNDLRNPKMCSKQSVVVPTQ